MAKYSNRDHEQMKRGSWPKKHWGTETIKEIEESSFISVSQFKDKEKPHINDGQKCQ